MGQIWPEGYIFDNPGVELWEALDQGNVRKDKDFEERDFG